MIIIHGSSTIGEDCTIYHEVTIGCLDHMSQKGPDIANNVYIGCKSAILGDINIATGTKIAAGAIVLKSTSSNQRIVGIFKEH